MNGMRLALLLNLFLLAGQFVFSQSENNVVFRIQLAASKTALAKTHKLFIDLPETEGVKFDDGYIRYYIGQFETFFEAKTFISEVLKPKGYNEAYVMAFNNGKLITVDEAIDIIYAE